MRTKRNKRPNFGHDDAEWCMQATEAQLNILRYLMDYRGDTSDLTLGKAWRLIYEFFARTKLLPKVGPRTPFKDRPPTVKQIVVLYGMGYRGDVRGMTRYDYHIAMARVLGKRRRKKHKARKLARRAAHQNIP